MRRGVFLGVFLALSGACVASAPSITRASPPVALLVVENQRTDAEWIYLERGGARGRRIGRVESLATDTIALREGDIMPGAPFALTAVAFAAGSADQSDPIIAERGVIYRWQLQPARGMSFLSRSAE